jgi:hypothetical protein
MTNFVFFIFLLINPFVARDKPRGDIFQPAGSYLVDQFKTKDVVLLGEAHRIREHAEFVARMIPLLHRNGINLLFSEFAYCEDSTLIDSLITGKVYNESLARFISWKNMWDWAYEEYIDVYYAAWKVNQDRQPGEDFFRIIGMEREDYGINDPEMFWARLVREKALDPGKKALIWCGLHHSFTNYNQPYCVNDSLKGFVTTRLGNLLYRKDPGRVMTVVLHAPLKSAPGVPAGFVLPVNGKIDSVVDRLPEDQREIGFNTSENWLADCSMENTFYATGYSGLLFKDLCQGYIVVKPVCDLHMVTLIPGFINDSNVGETRKMAEMGDLGPAEFNDTIRIRLETESKFLHDVQKRSCPSRQ